MDEKPEDYSQEDDAGLDLIDFNVLPHYLTAPFKKVTEKIITDFSDYTSGLSAAWHPLLWIEVNKWSHLPYFEQIISVCTGRIAFGLFSQCAIT